MSEETSERPAWKGHCYNWCGLTSENAKTRRNAKICCGTTFLLTVIIIILLFTVSVPILPLFEIPLIKRLLLGDHSCDHAKRCRPERYHSRVNGNL